MKCLIRNGLYRYVKDLFLYIGLLLSLGWGIWCGQQAARGGIDVGELNALLCIIVSVLSLCIGRKHAEGGFRNMLIKGHGKGSIFLCELALGVTAASAMILAFFGGVAVRGYRTTFYYFPRELCLKGAIGIFLALLFVCAVAIVVCCFVSRRVVTVLLNVALVFALWGVGDSISLDLKREKFRAPITLANLEWGSDIGHTPEEIEAILASAKSQGLELDPRQFASHASFTAEEIAAIKESAKAQGIDLEAGEAIILPDPNYVGGTRRVVYEWLLKVTPMGQLVQYDALIGPYFDPYNHWRLGIDDAERALLDRSPLYALGCTFAVGAAGFFLFRRRDLK